MNKKMIVILSISAVLVAVALTLFTAGYFMDGISQIAQNIK